VFFFVSRGAVPRLRRADADGRSFPSSPYVPMYAQARKEVHGALATQGRDAHPVYGHLNVLVVVVLVFASILLHVSSNGREGLPAWDPTPIY
jgi:hypothetical protein